MTDLVRPWLSVVGIGEDGTAGLSAAALALVDDAEVLIGGDRHLSMLADDERPRIPWPSPLSALVERIADYRSNRVACWRVATPSVSDRLDTVPTFRDGRHRHSCTRRRSLACARMGWPEHTTRLITLHGRPLSLLIPAPSSAVRGFSSCRRTKPHRRRSRPFWTGTGSAKARLPFWSASAVAGSGAPITVRGPLRTAHSTL